MLQHGRKHDYKLFVNSRMRFHPETESLEDSGYQGISLVTYQQSSAEKETERRYYIMSV